MIAFPSSVRVWLAVGRTDMRRGMTDLALQVRQSLGRDPHAGDLYVHLAGFAGTIQADAYGGYEGLIRESAAPGRNAPRIAHAACWAHAPEVECIGKGKAHKPYKFGVKVSVATPIERCKGGQLVAHVAALPGNPYDGHTLAKVVPEITRQIGVSLQRVVADAGYRGHNGPKGQGLSVFTSGQKRGVSNKIKRELRRRSAVEPVIGHLKADHRMDRNHLKGRNGDTANALLATIGYNFSLLLAWISLLWACVQNVVSENQKIKFV